MILSSRNVLKYIRSSLFVGLPLTVSQIESRVSREVRLAPGKGMEHLGAWLWDTAFHGQSQVTPQPPPK